MHEFKQATMIAPAPGFSERVMARIAEREARVARRRAFAGITLLLLVSAIPVLLVGAGFVSATLLALTTPETLLSAALTVALLAMDASSVIEALVISASVAVEAVRLEIIVYAVVVLGLTLFWMRVIGSSPQLSRNLSQ